MKFTLESSELNQLKLYTESSFFHSNTENLSDYWKYHSQNMSFHFEEGSIDISGDSGFYIPKSISQRIQTFFQNPIKLIEKIIEFYKAFSLRPKYLSWSEGFDAVMSSNPITDPDLSVYRINHKSLSREHLEILENVTKFK